MTSYSQGHMCCNHRDAKELQIVCITLTNRWEVYWILKVMSYKTQIGTEHMLLINMVIHANWEDPLCSSNANSVASSAKQMHWLKICVSSLGYGVLSPQQGALLFCSCQITFVIYLTDICIDICIELDLHTDTDIHYLGTAIFVHLYQIYNITGLMKDYIQSNIFRGVRLQC